MDIFRASETSTAAIVATTVVTTVACLSLFQYSLYPRRKQILPGPLTTSLPYLSKDEIKDLPYQPDHFPGARDVETPYGNIRVYEFGPEDGRKVLFIHGISTSCMTLSEIANGIAAKGCRVMLFDLFGRGFTDGVGDLPFDTRLFVSQILLVLASSPLAWTGDGAMHLVGYSLGGGIALNFAATFPRMVESLVLLAPTGVIRSENFGRLSRLIFTSGIVPEAILERLTKRRLRTPIGASVAKKRKMSTDAAAVAPLATSSKESLLDTANQEVVDPNEDTVDSVHPFEARIAAYVHWMLRAHEGFVPAFMSTVRVGPLMAEHDYWRKLARVRAPGTTAFILARHDELIQKNDYREDGLPLVGGEDHVFWRIVPGGHNFPFTHPKEALEAIFEFWGW
ncbi:C6 and C2H2 transcription factor RegA-like protein [Apiospora arundinis]|uniref:Alpha/Beta hydrolase protein n=1 Tax=Apiospora arundinis TaxID=335852 RepID=A0ABR2J517_9PEZI